MVEEYFGSFGEIMDFFMPKSGDKHKGIAFITYTSPQVAQGVLSQRHLLGEGDLVVEAAIERGPSTARETPVVVTPNETGKYKLFIANVAYAVTSQELAEGFSRFGQVDDVYIPKNAGTGISKGAATDLQRPHHQGLGVHDSARGSRRAPGLASSCTAPSRAVPNCTNGGPRSGRKTAVRVAFGTLPKRAVLLRPRTAVALEGVNTRSSG